MHQTRFLHSKQIPLNSVGFSWVWWILKRLLHSDARQVSRFLGSSCPSYPMVITYLPGCSPPVLIHDLVTSSNPQLPYFTVLVLLLVLFMFARRLQNRKQPVLFVCCKPIERVVEVPVSVSQLP